MRHLSLPRAVIGTLSCLALVGFGTLPAFSSTEKTPAVSTKPIVSAAHCARNRAAGSVTFVSPFLYDASAGIIDVVDAKLLGYFKQLCIDVTIEVPSFTLSPYELVSVGKGTVTGEGSAADMMLETANGANLVAVSTFGNASNYALLTRPNVTKLTQLNGKTVAYHTVLPVVLSEMLKKAGAKLSTIHLVNDNSFDPTALFAQKLDFSGLQAYQSNEPLTLAAAGYKKGSGFKEWTPQQFGVRGTFNVQLVNGTFLKKHPNTVADFLRAELHGLNFCLAHQSTCVTMEQSAASSAGYPGSLSHALAEWKLEAKLIGASTLAGKGIGVETRAEWRPEAQAVKAYGLVKSVPNLEKIENTDLVASLYRGKTLIWP
jgi:putative hydroxymethylpyrimidine transport system substrate-binding protein